jgi:hypothetical protein
MRNAGPHANATAASTTTAIGDSDLRAAALAINSRMTEATKDMNIITHLGSE